MEGRASANGGTYAMGRREGDVLARPRWSVRMSKRIQLPTSASIATRGVFGDPSLFSC